MSDTWVLKFPQIDQPEQPILVHVTKKNGHKLDLDLLATDGDAAFRGKLRGRNYVKQKSENYDGTDQEWCDILSYVLVSKKTPLNEGQRKNLEITCSISGKGSKSKLSMNFRTRIEDITHRLGVIELTYSENTDDVDLFGWTCKSIEQRDALETQLSSGNKNAQSAQDTINELQKQLDDLVKAKNEHEDQLFAKFQLLLDEKNLKIRNQQRVLSTAKVNQKTLDKIRSGMQHDTSDGVSTKRKRNEKEHEMVDEDDESDGFEAMEVDGPEDRNAASDSGDIQTEATETASEDEAEADLDGRASSKTETDQKIKPSRELSPPPPPRTLPFQKKGSNPTVPKSLEAATKNSTLDDADEETASEDDEL